MRLFVFVVFITGLVCSEETGVKKREGETVTLYMNKTAQAFQDYLWTFGRHNPVEAITIVTNGKVTRVNGTAFGNRLQTHVETGSITISNLTVNDSGVFLIQVFTETGVLTQSFNLTVRDNSVIPGNVLEGNNITLDTGVKELQKDHNVKWTQGQDFSGNLIAQWKNFTTTIAKGFEDVLQLNPHTGSLTIVGVTQNYAGFYCVMMLLRDEPHILMQHYVTVYESVSKPHVSTLQANITTQSLNDGDCDINCSVQNGPDVNLSWYRGEKNISQISNPDTSTNLTLPLKIQNQDEVMFSCVAANPVSKKVVTVNSTQWCPPHSTDPNVRKGIIGGVVSGMVVIAVALLVFWIYQKLRTKEGAPDCLNMRNMQEGTPTQRSEGSEGSNETMEQQHLLANNRGRLNQNGLNT